MKRTLLLVLISLFIINQKLNAQFSSELLQVAKLMQGVFSSEKQAKNDSDYYDIRLKILPIWKERTDAIWFYVEQAVASMLDKPYRQRVYRLSEISKDSFESAVYTLDNPLRFVKHLELLQDLNPDSLSLKDGCSVFLNKVGKKLYEGGTGIKLVPVI